LAAWGVYLGTVFGLRAIWTHGLEALDGAAFRAAYPSQRWLPTLHALLSWPAFLIALLGGPLLAKHLHGEALALSVGTWYTTSALNLFNGLFELLSGTGPTYGVLIKHHGKQGYLHGPAVRRLGAVRVLISAAIAAGTGLVAG
jgi:hypothetical protein